MAHLLIKRRAIFQDLLRSYETFVDGRPMGRLRARDFIDLVVPEGPRCVALRIDGRFSNHLCYFATATVPAVIECGPGSKVARRSLVGNMSEPWMTIRQTNAEAVLSGFIRGLATTLRQNHAARTLEPVILGDFRYSLGDLSLLEAAAQDHGSILTTIEVSWNHRLWTHIASVGWTRPIDLGLGGVIELRAFERTDSGRVELLDLCFS